MNVKLSILFVEKMEDFLHLIMAEYTDLKKALIELTDKELWK